MTKNNSNPSFVPIRTPGNCFHRNPAPKTKPSKPRPPSNQEPKPKRKRPVTFNSFSADAVANANIERFVEDNRFLKTGFRLPEAMRTFRLIRDTMLSTPTSGGRIFEQQLAYYHHRLEIGIVLEPEFRKGRGYMNPKFIRRLPSGQSPAKVRYRRYRWDADRRRFLLPTSVVNGNRIQRWVKGPYLFVGIVDNFTGEVHRSRLWPAWVSPSGRHFAAVQSGLERFMANVVHQFGLAWFIPTHKSHLELIQRHLGHRFAGQIGTWGYQPDALFFPKLGRLITLFECYGLRAIFKYNDLKLVKHEKALAAAARGEFSYLSYDAGRHSGKQAMEKACTAMQLLLQSSFHVWRSKHRRQ